MTPQPHRAIGTALARALDRTSVRPLSLRKGEHLPGGRLLKRDSGRRAPGRKTVASLIEYYWHGPGLVEFKAEALARLRTGQPIGRVAQHTGFTVEELREMLAGSN